MKKRTKEELNHIKNSWYMDDFGVLRWKRDAMHGKKAGDRVNIQTGKTGHQICYLQVNGKYTGYSLGQIAWFLYHGKWPDKEIDHIDCNPKNQMKDNLRLASRSQQCMNRISGKKGRPNKGVYKRNYGNKWTAQIWANGKAYCVGTFESEQEAIDARIKKMKEIHGDFANFQSY